MPSGSRTKSRLGKAEQARRTRRRVIAAATTLFVRDGYLTTTMAAIAAEAGVAVQTLYLSFGGKAAILHAALDIAVAGDDEPVPLDQRPASRAGRAQSDGAVSLTFTLDVVMTLIERVSPLLEAIRAAAADPEVAELLAERQRARHEVYVGVVRELSAKPGFTTELSVEDAAGVLYALLSEELYVMLVNEHGWSADQWRAWTRRTLLAQLFPQSALPEQQPAVTARSTGADR